MTRQRGQVLAFFALVLPIILVPIVAYAIDSAVLASKAGGLQAAAAQAAEVGAQQIDAAAFRFTGRVILDVRLAVAVASGVLAADEPGVILDQVVVGADSVTVSASEQVDPPIQLSGGRATLHARASARLVPGYSSSSSRLALPTSSF